MRVYVKANWCTTAAVSCNRVGGGGSGVECKLRRSGSFTWLCCVEELLTWFRRAFGGGTYIVIIRLEYELWRLLVHWLLEQGSPHVRQTA